ncbi:MAG TPA: hypothetical protein VHZ78_10020 [Rhizomicrobium sp.]|jgi:hypothetical protein|nr:hypothetical protein [Rhizomicrobium sp.]
MKPPWIAHPEIEFMSIGWRMGPGEAYWDKFDAWYKALTPDRRDKYERENPEPESWVGFYARKRAHIASQRNAN